MDNGYETYNLLEIKKIISEATQLEMWDTREDKEKWKVLQNMQTRLHDLFGIEEQIKNGLQRGKVCIIYFTKIINGKAAMYFCRMIDMK